MVKPMPMGAAGGQGGQPPIDPAVLEQLLQEQQGQGQPQMDPNDPNAVPPEGDPNDPNAVPPVQGEGDPNAEDEELNDPATYYNEGDDEGGDFSPEGDGDEEDPEGSRQMVQKGINPMSDTRSPLVVRDTELSELISAVVVKALGPFTAKLNELVEAQNAAPETIKSLVKAEFETVAKSLPVVPVVPETAPVVPKNPEASASDVTKSLGNGETIDPAAVVGLTDPATPAHNPVELVKSAVAIRDNPMIPASLKGDVVKALVPVQTDGDRSAESLQRLADAIKKVG